MNCNPILATNAGGIPYIVSTNTTVGTETVDIALGFRRIQPVGYLTIIINDVVPTATTATLPVTLTMNGTTRALTFANGTPVTAAALINVNNIQVFNDRTRGLLTLMSRTIA
ncbi:MAG: hypothetical protein IJ588_08715 [Prevotella sp.]|nr:hypothetical protein [Prevotella sp.]